MLYQNGSVSTLWDVTDLGHPRAIALPASNPTVDSMDGTGSVLAAVDVDHRAVVWRVGDRSVRRLPAPGVERTAMLRDGTGVILSRRDGDQHTVELWTLAGTRVATLLRAASPMNPHTGPGGLVATTSESGNLTLLNAADPHQPRTVTRVGGLGHPAVVAFDPAGRTVAVLGPNDARLWDATTGVTLLSLPIQGLGLVSPRVRGHELTVLNDNLAMWRLDSDLAGVISKICAGPVTVDWKRYFPGATRRRLCP